MLTGPARLMECIILGAFIACITFVAARIDYRDQAMKTCLERHSFDTCHSALNR